MAEPGPAAYPAPVAAPGVDAPHLARGFLFADLRDYTGFVEARGDHAGALLLARYRALVRGAVARLQGAEIRTEGDSFYVVFDSASAAVLAGQAIIAAAAETAADPDPIRVGVGVHAGETVETEEGFVGSAVNLAARLCAEAKAGELVVSDTVRALTRTYLDVEFQPLGLRRLKGVPEPVLCYRVAARGAAGAGAPAAFPAGRRPSGLIAAGLGLAALIAVAAVGVVLLGGGRAATPTPGPSVAGSPAGASASPGADAGGSLAAGSSTSPTPTASASPGPFPTTAEAAILAALPTALALTCVRGGTPNDASLAGFSGHIVQHVPEIGPDTLISVTPTGSRGGLTCHPATGATRLYVMEPASSTDTPVLPGASNWSIAGDEYLGFLAGFHKLAFGSCATDARAYELWSSPSGSGQLACMNPFDGRPWIYFTFGKGRYLAFATRDDSDYAALYQWWEQLRTFLP
jgi:class 3 adenylate cyclase